MYWDFILFLYLYFIVFNFTLADYTYYSWPLEMNPVTVNSRLYRLMAGNLGIASIIPAEHVQLANNMTMSRGYTLGLRELSC